MKPSGFETTQSLCLYCKIYRSHSFFRALQCVIQMEDLANLFAHLVQDLVKSLAFVTGKTRFSVNMPLHVIKSHENSKTVISPELYSYNN